MEPKEILRGRGHRLGGAWEGFTKEVSVTGIASVGWRERLASEMESVSAIRAVMTGST